MQDHHEELLFFISSAYSGREKVVSPTIFLIPEDFGTQHQGHFKFKTNFLCAPLCVHAFFCFTKVLFAVKAKFFCEHVP